MALNTLNDLKRIAHKTIRDSITLTNGPDGNFIVNLFSCNRRFNGKYTIEIHGITNDNAVRVASVIRKFTVDISGGEIQRIINSNDGDSPSVAKISIAFNGKTSDGETSDDLTLQLIINGTTSTSKDYSINTALEISDDPNNSVELLMTSESCTETDIAFLERSAYEVVTAGIIDTNPKRIIKLDTNFNGDDITTDSSSIKINAKGKSFKSEFDYAGLTANNMSIDTKSLSLISNGSVNINAAVANTNTGSVQINAYKTTIGGASSINIETPNIGVAASNTVLSGTNLQADITGSTHLNSNTLDIKTLNGINVVSGNKISINSAYSPINIKSASVVIGQYNAELNGAELNISGNVASMNSTGSIYLNSKGQMFVESNSIIHINSNDHININSPNGIYSRTNGQVLINTTAEMCLISDTTQINAKTNLNLRANSAVSINSPIVEITNASFIGSETLIGSNSLNVVTNSISIGSTSQKSFISTFNMQVNASQSIAINTPSMAINTNTGLNLKSKGPIAINGSATTITNATFVGSQTLINSNLLKVTTPNINIASGNTSIISYRTEVIDNKTWHEYQFGPNTSIVFDGRLAMSGNIEQHFNAPVSYGNVATFRSHIALIDMNRPGGENYGLISSNTTFLASDNSIRLSAVDANKPSQFAPDVNSNYSTLLLNRNNSKLTSRNIAIDTDDWLPTDSVTMPSTDRSVLIRGGKMRLVSYDLELTAANTVSIDAKNVVFGNTSLNTTSITVNSITSTGSIQSNSMATNSIKVGKWTVAESEGNLVFTL